MGSIRVDISNVAIGGANSWRSENMEKIKKLANSDVTTILRFILPFSLLKLSDGFYEMKDCDNKYKISIKKYNRTKETAKELTGWVPDGKIEIISDRFGRFSYSDVEVVIPFRIDENMFDYVCTTCKTYVMKSTDTCPICGSKFSLEKGRVRPRSKAKENAIEIINKLIDKYRLSFKDYSIEHIIYNDIIAYNIEYKSKDGMKAQWDESFSLIFGSFLTTGDLIAKPEEIKIFHESLSNPEIDTTLRDYLIASSENRIHSEEYHLAILESVIALEITLSKYILKETEKLGVSKQSAKNFIREVGLYTNIDAVLKILTKGKEQLDDLIYIGCSEAINKRNDIVHRGMNIATYNDARKAIWNTQKMIQYITKIEGSI
jgi:DNA-directed RNA polymerase subunit RPC12/RpoP